MFSEIRQRLTSEVGKLLTAILITLIAFTIPANSQQGPSDLDRDRPGSAKR